MVELTMIIFALVVAIAIFAPKGSAEQRAERYCSVSEAGPTKQRNYRDIFWLDHKLYEHVTTLMDEKVRKDPGYKLLIDNRNLLPVRLGCDYGELIIGYSDACGCLSVKLKAIDKRLIWEDSVKDRIAERLSAVLLNESEAYLLLDSANVEHDFSKLSGERDWAKIKETLEKL